MINLCYITKLATVMAIPPTRADIFMGYFCVTRKHILELVDVLQNKPDSPKLLFFFGFMLGRMHYLMQTLNRIYGIPIYNKLVHLKLYDIPDAYHTMLVPHQPITSHIDQGFAIGYMELYVLINTNRLHAFDMSAYTKAYQLKDYSHVKKIFLDLLSGHYSPPLISLVKNVFPLGIPEWKQIKVELHLEFDKMSSIL